MSWFIHIPRAQSGPGNPVTFIDSYSVIALYTNPADFNFTLPSNASVLIVSIRCVNLAARVAGAPTWNGVALTQAGSYAGSGAYSEIWYLNNPASGAHTLSIPNDTISNMQVSASWFTCDSPLEVSGTNYTTGNDTAPSATLAIPSGKNLLVIDALSVRNSQTGHLEFTNSHVRIFSGLGGASFGSGCQYSAFLSSTSGITMSYTILVTKVWHQLIVGFKTI